LHRGVIWGGDDRAVRLLRRGGTATAANVDEFEFRTDRAILHRQQDAHTHRHRRWAAGDLFDVALASWAGSGSWKYCGGGSRARTWARRNCLVAYNVVAYNMVAYNVVAYNNGNRLSFILVPDETSSPQMCAGERFGEFRPRPKP
jgi:hypothetical protein